MRPDQRLPRFDELLAPQEASPHGAVAQGGVVADWHRMIEARFGDASASDQRLDGALRLISRLAGYTALVAAYSAVGLMIFG